jgi:hypothetical protein
MSREALQTGAGKAHDDAPTPLRRTTGGPVLPTDSVRAYLRQTTPRAPGCCTTTSNNGSSTGRVGLVSGRSVSVFVCLTLAGTFLTRAHSQMW